MSLLPKLPLTKDALIHAFLAVAALPGVRGVRGIAAVQATVLVQVQQQVGGAHSAIVGTRPLAFNAALVTSFTLEFLFLSYSVLPHEAVGGATSSHQVVTPYTG